MNRALSDRRVPYYSQWESAELIPDFIARSRPAFADPLWPKSGADSPEEYAFWAPRICGVACTRMALDCFGRPVPPSVPLVRELLDAGAYVRDGDQVKGLIYNPYAAWLTYRFGIHAEVDTELAPNRIREAVEASGLVVISVHKTIRTLDPAPPSRGGHLVLVVDTDDSGAYVNNPSGLPGRSQHYAHVPWADLDRFFAGRGIILHDQNGTPA